MNQVAIPGKVMLSGEYAVLHGGTAVLVPAPRELLLRVAEPAEEGDRTPVLDQALALVITELAEAEADLPPLAVKLDRSAFLATAPDGRPAKLGLGGSAAEAVAAIALRFERAGLDWSDKPQRVFELADAAHCAAQGGVGSGADVACCAYRRPIRFRRERDEVGIVPIPRPIPEHELPLHLLWTGVSANTRQLVKPYLAWADLPTAQPALDELRAAVNELAGQWYATPLNRLYATLDEVNLLMETVMADAGVSWRLPIHDELDQWARAHGGRAKPTGAGGGDLVLLVGDLPLHERPELSISLTPFS